MTHDTGQFGERIIFRNKIWLYAIGDITVGHAFSHAWSDAGDVTLTLGHYQRIVGKR